jgi:carboxymethylenebutenolidase
MATNSARISLSTPSGPMGCFETIPDTPARGALIIVHGAFGPNAHVDELGQRFANYGYRTIAPNLYHRTTETPLSRAELVDPTSVERVCKPHLNALSSDTCTEDLAACIDHLGAAGIDRTHVAVIGFCLGGSVAFLAGVNWPLGAVVSFYGGSSSAVANLGFSRSLVAMAKDLQTPYLGLFGDHDTIIPVREVEEIRAALARAEIPYDVVRYPYAGHGFHDDDLPELYVREAAQDAERRTFDWLGRHMP